MKGQTYNMRVFSAILLVMLAAGLCSCGYSMNGSGAISDGANGEYNSIAISMFTNDTFEPFLEKELTAALKKEIAYNGRLALVEAGDADLVVTGNVTQFELQPLSYDPAERIQEYRLRIVSQVNVIVTGGGELIWKNPRMEAYADYRVTQDVTKSKINKNEAIKKASRNLAEIFIIRVLDTL